MRRFGVYLYFLLSVLAQLGLAWKARHMAILIGNRTLRTLTNWQLAVATIPFFLGVLNVALKSSLDNSSQAENIIEWIVALLMQVYFVLAWAAWRQTRFSAQYSLGIS
jgi:hypothetical protein